LSVITLIGLKEKMKEFSAKNFDHLKVSVLMPVYRTPEKFLRESIESILAQTFTDYEFLILDDCPEHPVEEIVNSYQDKRIKYLKNEKNLGISESRNKLVSLSKGEYLAITDHDDISMPERFAKQVNYLDKNPNVGVVSTSLKLIISKKNLINPENNRDIKVALMKGCYIAHPASMIRKSVMISNNIKYEETYSPAEDYKLWCELLPFTDFYNIQEPLLKYRDWENNTTNKQKEKMWLAEMQIRSENRVKHPEIYAISDDTKVQRILLFGFIPFMKIISKNRRKTYLLFNFIPILRINLSYR